MQSTPQATVDDYIRYFSSKSLPVLRRSMKTLAELRDREENVSGRILATEVLRDPLLALHLLIHLENHRSLSQNHDITTIDRAIMMMGITPFFSKFCDLPTVEEALSTHPKALVGVLRVITRARNAAQWARDWALIRHDIDVDEITVAALLHNAAEILLWCFAPELMQNIVSICQQNPGIRSQAAQIHILGFPIRDLQLALVRAWHLPNLLVSLMDEDHAASPRVLNVLLACNLARHAANGWSDPALPDDYAAISELLHMNKELLLQKIGVPEEHRPAITPQDQIPPQP